MKAAILAAALSAFLFPGAGQLYLRKIGRGLVLLAATLAALGAVIGPAVSTALRTIEGTMTGTGAGVPDLQAISDIVASQDLTAAPLSRAAFYLLVGIWLFGIVDAFRIGRKKESGDRQTPSG